MKPINVLLDYDKLMWLERETHGFNLSGFIRDVIDKTIEEVKEAKEKNGTT